MRSAFEATAEVVLSSSDNRMPPATAPESFGFIITVGAESFSSAVVPRGSGHLVAGQPAQVCLRFLFPEAAAGFVRTGTEFSFFEQYRVGRGRVLSVRHA